MNRRSVMLAGGTVAATLLAGCTSRAIDPNDGNDPSDGNQRTISVSDTGSVEAEPDLAVIRTSVEVTGDDVGEVRDDLATQSEELFDALVSVGIEEDHISTGRFDIRERIDERQMREDDVRPESEADLDDYRYYVGTHEYTVEIHDVDRIGEVVDTAIDGGADQAGRIQFTVSDEKREALREHALQEAIESATAEAEFIAHEIDATLVEAMTIDSSGGRVSPVYEDTVADDRDDTATEFRPDDVTVRATVDIVFTID